MQELGSNRSAVAWPGEVFRAVLLGLVAAAAVGCAAQAPLAEPAAPSAATPPSKPAAAELSFADFYRMPVGPLGLEPTPKLLALNGQRVEIRGFMAHEDEPFPGVFMMAVMPVTVAERADGAADDLPPATIFVHLPPERAQRVIEYQAGPLVVEGTLQLGAYEEASGRVSYVRLLLDSPTEETPRAAQAQASAGSR